MTFIADGIADWVEQAALDLVHLNDLDEIESSLTAKGCPAAVACKLLLLIPSAFAAQHYEAQGIQFPKAFLVGEPGSFQERQYVDEPVYACARQLAQRWEQESRPSLISRVLDWSCEEAGIKEAHAQGKTPTEISMVHHGF
jgi:hypothetical protein